jgi:hypothetical protein
MIPKPRSGHVEQNPSRKERKEEKSEDALTGEKAATKGMRT